MGLKMLSRKRNLSGGGKDDDLRRPASAGGMEKPRKSVKERLGEKKVVKKEAVPMNVRLSSVDRGRREELLRRAEVRRQNQEKSPIPYQGKRRSRSPRRRKKATHHNPEAEMGGRRVDQGAIGEGGGVHLGVETGTYLESPEEAAQGHEMQREGLVAPFE